MAQNKYNIPQTQDIIDNNPVPTNVFGIGAYDNQTYFISFEKYKYKDCEFNNLISASYKKALEWIKDAGKCNCPEDIISIKGKNKPINNANDYKDLFNGLPDDVEEMREQYLSGENRMFYYTDDGKKIIYIRLLKNSHKETDKNKN